MGFFVSRLLGMAGTVIITRLLSPSDYGILTLTFSLLGMFKIVSDLQITSAFVHDLAAYKILNKHANIRKMFVDYLKIKSILMIVYLLVTFMAGYIFSHNLRNPHIFQLLLLAFVGTIGTTFSDILIAFFFGYQKMGYVSLARIFSSASGNFLTPLFLLLGLGLFGAILGKVIGSYLTLAFAIFLFFKFLYSNIWSKDHIHVRNHEDSDTHFLRDAIKFSSPLIFVYFLSGLYTNSYSLFLGYFQDLSEVGYFHVSLTVIMVLTEIFRQPDTALRPYLSAMMARREEEIQRTVSYLVLFVTFLTGPLVVFLMIFAGEVIEIVFSVKYIQAVPSLIILSPSIILMTLIYTSQGLLWAIKATGTIAKGVTVAVSVGFISLFVMIPTLGSVGAALSLLIYNAVNLLMLYPLMIKECGIVFPIRRIVKILSLSAITGLVILPISLVNFSNIERIVLGAFVGLFTYLLLSFHLKSITKDEIGHFLRILRTLPFLGTIFSA